MAMQSSSEDRGSFALVVLEPARHYAGLQPASNPFSAFQVFPADPLYRFPILRLEEEETAGFIESERESLKQCLERLQEESPFRRGLSEAFPDEPSSPEQPAPANSLQSSSAAFEDLSQYADPLQQSRDFFRGSLSRSRLSDYSDGPSRAEISVNTREMLYSIQKAFAARQDDRQLQSITPDSSFFQHSKASEIADPPQAEQQSEASDQSVTEWDARPSTRKSYFSEVSEEMSVVEEGSAERPHVFPIAPTLSRAGTMRMPAIKEEDSSGGCSPSHPHPSPPKAVYIPEKLLMASVTPTSFATFVEAKPLRDGYSPIISKMAVFWQKSASEYELQAAFPLSGFAATAALQFSNTRSRGKPGQPPPVFGLFAAKPIAYLLKAEIAWITCGFEHAAALTGSGKVLTWGYGAAGVLGHGDTNSVFRPKTVDALIGRMVYIESGAYHTVAISDQGELWSWGRGDMWQLGLPKSAMFKDDIGQVALRPQIVPFFHERKAQGVACGEAHTLVVDATGQLYAFGWGAYGQLGTGPLDPRQTGIEQATKVPDIGKVVSVSCGLVFSACVTGNGQVWVWGSGDAGQLGLGGTIKQTFMPLRVNSLLRENVIDVVCGETHVIVVTRSGAVYAWGTGLAGVFSGPKNTAFREGSEIVCYVPQQLSGLDIVQRISTPQPSETQDLIAKLQQLQALDISLAAIV